MGFASKKVVTLVLGVAAAVGPALAGTAATAAPAVPVPIGAAAGSATAVPAVLIGRPGGITPTDCLCGGPGGSADLGHISPWLNNDCDSSVQVGTSSVYVWVQGSSGLAKTYAGWSEWRYSSYRSCHGYQWVRYHLNMSVVNRSTVAGGFATMMWLSQDPLDWTTFTTNFTGGASDGAFSTYAVMAGPLRTTAGILTSLAQFGPNRNWISV